VALGINFVANVLPANAYRKLPVTKIECDNSFSVIFACDMRYIFMRIGKYKNI
jgi:hypothetical protein